MKQKEKLIKLIEEHCDDVCYVDCKEDCTACLADYLIKKGVVVLPVKVGETVYDISEYLDGTNAPEIYEYKANEITISKLNGEMIFEIDSIFMRHQDFGKALFLTREEAERALAERREDER